ncbi:Holliday junction resolvase-like protein [Chloroflexota bacterium]
MEIALFVIIFILLVIVIFLVLRPRKVEVPAVDELEAKLRFALASADSIRELKDVIAGIPRDVLTSITRSQGTRSGKLNELLATLELAKYDRLFYIGAPIDFIGVDYEKGIDFIEVKSGRSRFTEDEIKLKDLVECKMVNYISLNVSRFNVVDDVTGEINFEEES